MFQNDLIWFRRDKITHTVYCKRKIRTYLIIEDQQYNFRGQQRNGATDDVDSGFMWSHDKYEEVQQELQRAKSSEKK
uniref:Uncharacterized protein n=1 Tax=Romanomermis culicivorax TaxID=13658 RepID=A0A915KEA2_ROMCU